MFKPVDSRVDFPALEAEILSWWQEKDIPKKYMKRNEGADKRNSFIDGPITANNPMGVHHAWGRTYKDLFLRYKAMQGYDQRYQNGFDGQGLWIEVEVEKELGFKSKRDIEAFGVGKFVELCKERVDRFAEVISNQSVRLGYWMDWEDSYHTKSDENNYTIWHFLKVCHEKGWIYEGRDVMPWCPRCGTGLSEHEIVTEGYKEIVHPGLFVKFPIVDRDNESLLVWTTTPWTLTSNIAAAVHPEKTYVKVKQGDDVLYLIKERTNVLKGEFEVLEEVPSSQLVGLRYSGPFDELTAQQGVEHRVVAWDEVTEVEGTGIVHVAPGAGKEDFALGKEEGLSAIAPLNEHGDFIEGFDWLTGQNVYDVNDAIYASLKEKGVFYNLERYSHRYPVCWRCDSELVFRLVDEWFISMGQKYEKPREEVTAEEKANSLRYQIMDVVDNIRWVPEFGYARELDWLRNMDDWMISKKRYYGLALPLYKCKCGHFEIMGSETELQERAIEGWDEFEGHSPHRPWIDAVKIACSQCGEKVSRITDVGNAWLDAGIVPFSTLKYRHDKEYWKKWFPANWISESFPGQFRNWFYSLLTMSTALENTEPFKAVFSYALMRDETGDEMHKSKGNAIWFEDAAEQMGVDAMRWVFARVNPSNNINFGFKTADEARRQFIIPLWNVYSFFVTYANIDEYDPSTPAPAVERRPELDRWIISELNLLIAEVCDALDDFEPDRASRNVEGFVGYLSNWYVRRSRRRFWKAGILSEQGADEDKLSAYATLYECLVTLIKLLAPFMPFMTDAMYQNLVGSVSGAKESIHLDDYPEADMSKVDQRLSDATRLAMRISSMGRAARSKSGLKVRQPLERALVKLRSKEEAELLPQIAPQVQDEINVKEIVALIDETQVMEFTVQPNMPVLGPKYGADMRKIASALSEADPVEVYTAISSGRNVMAGGFEVEPHEVLVTTTDKEGYAVTNEGGYAIAITTEVSPELRLEGQARELVHRIQNMRRSADFDISDYIVTYYQGGSELDKVISAHSGYIKQETLSRELRKETPAKGAYIEEYDADGLRATIGVKKEG